MSRFVPVVTLWCLLASFGMGQETYDVVVYGGTSAGVIAAVQAKKMGKSAVLVGPDKHLGGLTSGGLGWTDTGNKAVIGGLSRDFYHRVWKKYQEEQAWKWQRREEYGNKGQGNEAIDGNQRTMWIFEPHIAESVFDELVREWKIPVFREEYLDRESGVLKSGQKIETIRMHSGKEFRGRMFIDATYEGDLMASAGVKYHIGREANAVYGEKWNGIQVGVLHHRHHFGAVKQPISPYVVSGDPASGVVPKVSTQPPGNYGEGDHRIQAYCFRTCFTKHEPNRVPFPKPQGYDPSHYVLAARVFQAGWRETFDKFDPIPNWKTDTNNHGPFSSDNVGMNYDYPEATYARRKEIVEEHRRYQQGLLYFWANDPSVPEDVRKEVSAWGLAKDEFVDNGNWPHQLYIREARRMIGQYVMTENELLKRRPTPQSIGMGSYTIDSHNVQRYITQDGYVQNEGDIGVATKGPYEIAYGSILPKKDQCENLLVPVCVSSSHIAFGSIRMEPVFMILGHSAAAAAALSIDRKCAPQDLPFDVLEKRLLDDGQVLHHASAETAQSEKPLPKLGGIWVDDGQAELEGEWRASTSAPQFFGDSYQHDGKDSAGKHAAKYSAKIEKAGRYQVRISYPPNANRSTKTKVTIEFNGKVLGTKLIDQRKAPTIDGWFVEVGTYELDPGTSTVRITNEGSDGYVVIDLVQWLQVP